MSVDLAGKSIGAYRIVARIGRGGMGDVYVAEHGGFGRRAAVKVLSPSLAANADLLARFFNEARATNRVRHPGIVDIYDCGEAPGVGAYLMMELLEGESLEALLAREKHLALGAVVDLVEQVASALAAAHAHGIVHRDLKPPNLFVQPPVLEGRAPRYKVLDFGIAKLRGDAGGAGGAGDAPETQPSVMMGTPTYMAPEQCHGAADVDHRADIYALGVIAFQALCGRPPFVGASGTLVAKHLGEAPPPASRFRADLPSAIDAVLARALAKDPAARVQSMADFARAFAAAARGEAAPEPEATAPALPGGRARAGGNVLERAAAGSVDPTGETIAATPSSGGRTERGAARTVVEGAARPTDAGEVAAARRAGAGESAVPRGAGPAGRRTAVAAVAVALVLTAAGGVWRWLRADAGGGAGETATGAGATSGPKAGAVGLTAELGPASGPATATAVVAAFLPFENATGFTSLAFVAHGVSRELGVRAAGPAGAVSYDELRDVLGPRAVARADWELTARGRGATHLIDGTVSGPPDGRMTLSVRLWALQASGPARVIAEWAFSGEAFRLDAILGAAADVLRQRLAVAVVAANGGATPETAPVGTAAPIGTEPIAVTAAPVRSYAALRAHHVGVDAERRGDFGAAVTHLGEAVKLEPKNADAWFHLSLAHFWRSELHADTAVFDRALALLGERPRERDLVAAARLMSTDRFAEAADLVRPLLHAHPRDRDVLTALGEAYYHGGDTEGGLAAFRASRMVAPAHLVAVWHPFRAAISANDGTTADELALLVRAHGDPAAAEAVELLLLARHSYAEALARADAVLGPGGAAATGTGGALREAALLVRLAMTLSRGDLAAARELPAEDVSFEAGGWSAATLRYALTLGAGDATGIRAASDEAARLASLRPSPDARASHRATLGIVRALAGDAAGTREVLATLAAEPPPPPVRAALVFRAVAAHLLRDPSLLAEPLAAVETEIRFLAEGLRAELGGDRAAAVTALYTALADLNDGQFDLVLHHALARNQFALGDRASVTDHCAAIRVPAAYAPYREPAVLDCARWAR